MTERAQRVLVTGAAGFIGARLVRQLVEEGNDVFAAVRPGRPLGRLAPLGKKICLLEADLDQADDVRRMVETARPERAYHLAWYTEPGDYVSAVGENLSSVRMGLSVLHALVEAGCEGLVFAGSCAEYGPSRAPLTESSTCRPRTVYGASKLALATVALPAAAQARAKLAWARIFYVFGPDEDRRRTIPSAILRMQEGAPVALPRGDDVLDVLHVDDVASALVTLGRAGHHGIANVCSGVPVFSRSLLEDLARLTGGQITPEDPGLRSGHEGTVSVGRCDVLGALGWGRRWGLPEGLSDVVSWWRAHPPVHA